MRKRKDIGIIDKLRLIWLTKRQEKQAFRVMASKTQRLDALARFFNISIKHANIYFKKNMDSMSPNEFDRFIDRCTRIIYRYNKDLTLILIEQQKCNFKLLRSEVDFIFRLHLMDIG